MRTLVVADTKKRGLTFRELVAKMKAGPHYDKFLKTSASSDYLAPNGVMVTRMTPEERVAIDALEFERRADPGYEAVRPYSFDWVRRVKAGPEVTAAGRYVPDARIATPRYLGEREVIKVEADRLHVFVDAHPFLTLLRRHPAATVRLTGTAHYYRDMLLWQADGRLDAVLMVIRIEGYPYPKA